jgi:hypothetical protein
MESTISSSPIICYPKGKHPSPLAIEGKKKISWGDIYPCAVTVCPDPSDFIAPDPHPLFQTVSKAKTEFDSMVFNVGRNIVCSYGRKEEDFFKSYIKWIEINYPPESIFLTPALLPETEIKISHYHYEKGSTEPSSRESMYVDFFWRDQSVCESDVVIEIDGNSHFEPVKENALKNHSPESDAERMRVFTNHTIRERELALCGFKVFRFSISELERPNLDEFLHPFFDQVFKR